MSEHFVTKRPHKKSRAGCSTCKTKKIKCDEIRPACTFCAFRKILCSYAATATPRTNNLTSPSSPDSVVRSSNSSSSPEQELDVLVGIQQPLNSLSSVLLAPCPMSSADMRVMHHWSTFTWNKVGVGQPGMDRVLQVILPGLAFDHEYLLNGVLGLASLHMQRLLPASVETRKQTDIYRAKAFSGFRQALSRFDQKSTEDYEAALLMAILLVILCSQDHHTDDDDELTVVEWIVLYRGLSVVITFRTYDEISTTKVSPLFNREITPLKTTPIIPTILMDMVAKIEFTDPDFESIEWYCQGLDSLAMLFASLSQDGLTTPLFTRIITFPSFLEAQFAALAKENRPRALVVLAWYLAFIKLIKDLWWVEGIPERDIVKIRRIIGPELSVYIEIPFRSIMAEDKEEGAKILLGESTPF